MPLVPLPGASVSTFLSANYHAHLPVEEEARGIVVGDEEHLVPGDEGSNLVAHHADAAVLGHGLRGRGRALLERYVYMVLVPGVGVWRAWW
jgi:hypothetical protein